MSSGVPSLGGTYAHGVRQITDPTVPEGAGPSPDDLRRQYAGGAGTTPGGLPNLGQGISSVAAALQALPGMVGLGGQQTAPVSLDSTGGGWGAGGAPRRADDIGSAYTPGTLAGGGTGGMPQYTGNLNRMLNESVGERLLAKPDAAMNAAFRQLGVDPMNNMFARRAVERYAPVMGSLAEIWSWVATGDPNNVDAAQMMPKFLQHFMSGGDVKGLMAQAFKMATPGSLAEDALAGLGADELYGIMEATKGTAPLMAAARKRALERRLMDRSIADLSRPMEEKDTAYLQDIRNVYGI
jgi:hypothetical protein